MNQQIQNLTPKQFLKSFTIIHLALCLMPFVFSIIVLFLINDFSLTSFEFDSPLVLIAPIAAILGPLLSNFIFNNRIKHINNSEKSLKDKLFEYQSISLIRYTLIEAPAIFCIVVILLTENVFLILLPWILIIYLYQLRPSKQRIEDELVLNFEEKSQFNKMYDILA